MMFTWPVYRYAFHIIDLDIIHAAPDHNFLRGRQAVRSVIAVTNQTLTFSINTLDSQTVVSTEFVPSLVHAVFVKPSYFFRGQRFGISHFVHIITFHVVLWTFFRYRLVIVFPWKNQKQFVIHSYFSSIHCPVSNVIKKNMIILHSDSYHTWIFVHRKTRRMKSRREGEGGERELKIEKTSIK